MKKISVNIPADVLAHIEWLKIYLQEKAPIRYKTTDIIIIAIENLYVKCKNESNKSDSK